MLQSVSSVFVVYRRKTLTGSPDPTHANGMDKTLHYHQHGVMCGLAPLHTAVTLGHRRIVLNDGTNLEFMFCPHCGYFTNNPTTMNTHVQKHYKAGLFCAHASCDFVTNRVESMLHHGSLLHGYGKRNKGTPVKSKSYIGFSLKVASVIIRLPWQNCCNHKLFYSV